MNRLNESDLILEVYKAVRAHELMLNEATSRFEHAVIAPLFLLNGGASVAYLTLLGATADPNKSRLAINALWIPFAIGMWGLGLALAAWSVMFGLRVQRAYSRREQGRRKNIERHLLYRLNYKTPDDLLKRPEKKEREDEEEDPKESRKKFVRAQTSSLLLFVGGLVAAAFSILL